MKFLVVLALASTACAAKLDKVYLPPNSASSSGANVGLRTPFGPDASNYQAQLSSQNYNQAQASASQNYANQAQASASQNYANQAQILRYENEIDDQGWHYAYETSDGTQAEQNGRILPGSAPEEGSIQVSGSYSYVGDDGQTYSVSYTADENGYQPTGDHLPTPPPIPEEILKSLQLTDVNGQYGSHKSSYDADAGY